jgi:gluconate 5-dehydrogenase
MNFKQLFDMQGQVVGITGGGGHLGSAMALGLASAGADVFICGRDEKKLKLVANEVQKQGYKGQIFYQSLDVTDTVKLENFIQFIVEKRKFLSGWVNNASSAISEQQGQMTQDGVNTSLNLCLTQMMLGTQAAAEKMISTGGGSIINVSSMYGMVSPQPGLYDNYPEFHNPPVYGAAKAGIIQYTRYAACHLAKNKIRVNCISPGPFPKKIVQKETGFVQELEKRAPLNRIGEPIDLVGPVIFLLSQASAYITGHNLTVDGGWTAW